MFRNIYLSTYNTELLETKPTQNARRPRSFHTKTIRKTIFVKVCFCLFVLSCLRAYCLDSSKYISTLWSSQKQTEFSSLIFSLWPRVKVSYHLAAGITVKRLEINGMWSLKWFDIILNDLKCIHGYRTSYSLLFFKVIKWHIGIEFYSLTLFKLLRDHQMSHAAGCFFWKDEFYVQNVLLTLRDL